MAEVHRRFAAHTHDGLAMADMHALHFIAHHGPVTPGQITGFTGLTSGSVTGLLDRLEKMDLVQRRRSESDRRTVHVHMIDGAHERMTHRMQGFHSAIGDLFEGWDAQNISELTDLLDAIRLET